MNLWNNPLHDLANAVKYKPPPEWRWKLCYFQHRKGISVFFFFSIAFITGNSSLEPLLEGLCAQIHVNLSCRVFGRNRTWDLRMTTFLECRALHH